MKRLWLCLPWFFVALFGAEMVAVLSPKKDGEWRLREFARLPVLLNGRIQPFDSVARNALLQIRSTRDVPLEEVPSWKFWHHPRKLKATAWLLEVMLKPEVADTRPIFLIHHPELLGELKLQDKGVERSGLRYYTFNELRTVGQEVLDQANKVREVKPELQTPFQKQTLKLANALVLYHKLKSSLEPESSDDFAGELTNFEKAIGPGIVAARASRAGKEYDKKALDRLLEQLGNFDRMAQLAYPLIVPPRHPEVSRDAWVNAGVSLLDSAREGEIHPAMTWFSQMATAYRHGHAAEFNRAITHYTTWLGQNFAPERNKSRLEFFYNDTNAFLHAMIIYIAAFVLAGASLLTTGVTPNLSESLRRSSFCLILLAGVIHTSGLVLRMVLEGRPPVTNLYSSAIFIGWGAMVLGVVLERIYRIGIGNCVASLAGFVTLIIAHNLALGGDGDTMEMLRAVLDTNFWLATHVVVVTLGYASTFVAGLLAIIYIVLGVFTPLLTQKLTRRSAAALSAGVGLVGGPKAGISSGMGLSSDVGRTEVGKALAKMVYGIVCFATLFSFVGTILGGIWADQSWGRFWGWDPKENGALMIVLWNAIILHARWGGLVRDRGLMNLAVVGNIITSFSWFGVNMLGIGLHAYGFMDAAFKWLMGFVASQLLLIGLGLLPLSWWRSFRAAKPAEPSEPPRGGQEKPLPA